MLATSLLAAILLWFPVTLDCDGSPESGVAYEVSYMYRICPETHLDAPPPCSTFFVRLLQDEPYFATAIGDDPPGPSEGYWYQIRIRDGAGNWSDACEVSP